MATDDDKLNTYDETRRLYEFTGDPLLVWQTYMWSRYLGDPVPDWVFAAFDRMADQLDKCLTGTTLSEQKPGIEYVIQPVTDHWKDALLRAHGYRGEDVRGGPQNPFRGFFDRSEEIDHARRVRVLVDGDGHAPANAYYLAAKRWSLYNEPKVRRAWERYRDFVRAEDLDEQRRRLAEKDEWIARENEQNSNDYDRD